MLGIARGAGPRKDVPSVLGLARDALEPRAIAGTEGRGEQPVDRPVTPADLGATILSRLGIGTTDLTGIGLTPAGEVIEDLF